MATNFLSFSAFPVIYNRTRVYNSKYNKIQCFNINLDSVCTVVLILYIPCDMLCFLLLETNHMHIHKYIKHTYIVPCYMFRRSAAIIRE